MPTYYLLNGVPTFNSTGSSTIIIGTGLFSDGTAGAPSIAFLNQTSLGFYRASVGTIGCTGNLTVSGGSLVLNGGGTGVVYFGAPSNNYLYFDGTDLFTRVGGSDRMVIKSGGNVLLGTVVNSGALLQIGTNTTNAAGGMIFGTDFNFYRASNFGLALAKSGTKTLFTYQDTNYCGFFDVLDGGPNCDGFLFSPGSKLIFAYTNGQLALTIDSSQNVTFAGRIFFPAGGSAQSPYIISTANNLDIKSGDGAFRIINNAASQANFTVSDAGNVTIVSGGSLQLGSAYTPGAPAATGYVTIKANNGTTYKVLVST